MDTLPPLFLSWIAMEGSRSDLDKIKQLEHEPYRKWRELGGNRYILQVWWDEQRAKVEDDFDVSPNGEAEAPLGLLIKALEERFGG